MLGMKKDSSAGGFELLGISSEKIKEQNSDLESQMAATETKTSGITNNSQHQHSNSKASDSPLQVTSEDEATLNASDADPNSNIVWWDGEDDPENPYNWPAWQKYLNCGLISALTFITPLASSIFAPGVPKLMVDFEETNQELGAFVVSVYVLGFAFGPMLMAPLSEVYGRTIVYHVCNILFVCFTVGCALAPNMTALIVFRDDGLVLWRCEVRCGRGHDGLLSAVHFNVETRNDEMVKWLRMDEKRSCETLDAYNVKWIKDKLGRCEERCNHVRDDTGFLPTRLIHTGAKTRNDVQLISTANLPMNETGDNRHVIEYATLSYCWGPKEDAAKQVKTTKSNLSQHLKGLPLTYVSPVVRDAILVCKALDIGYLWVDALCILQDDSGDWDKESEMMGRIYYDSFLTICPSSPNSCLEGFLGPRPKGLDIEFHSRRKSIRGTYTFFENPRLSILDEPRFVNCQDLDIDQSSWRTRGWAFQEEALPPRILFFGTSMCHFSCRSGSISENAYQTRIDGLHRKGRHMMSSAWMSEEPDPCRERLEFLALWRAIWKIQGRKWTYGEDVFPAISGFAKQYASKANDVYIAGFWKNTLHLDLTWSICWPDLGDLDRTMQRIRLQSPYIAPSWIWASQKKTCGPCVCSSYPITERQSDELPLKNSVWAIQLPSHARSELTLEDMQMDLWGNNPFGRLKAGFIKVSGKVAPFPSEAAMGPRTHHPSWGYLLNGLGTCLFDWSPESSTVQQPGKLQLLLVSSCCAATSNWKALIYRANPEEDHEQLHRAFIESNPVCRALEEEDYVPSQDCRCCKDEGLARNASGIIIHPAEEPGSFYRVGAFFLLVYSGGANFFNHVENQTVKLL